MAAVMLSFLAGLFVGEGTFEGIRDNLDLERWFRLPKSHERRIHGHRHAGIRIVLEGPTLVHALDAHVAHPEPFSAEDLLPYRTAREPPCQQEALNRRKIMRKARSKKNRPILLADLERRYQEIPSFKLSRGSLLKFRTAGFPQYGFKFQAPLSSAGGLPVALGGLSVILTFAAFSHSWPSPSDSPRLVSVPPRCAGLQRLTIPPGPRGPRSGEFLIASPSSLTDLIRQSGLLRSISQQSWL